VIYVDHNATTPLAPEVLDRMLPFLREEFGNASSIHAAGQRARHAVDDAREQVAALIHSAPKELVFTSGGTEANNLAIRGVFAARQDVRKRIVTTVVEHPAVLDTVRSLGSAGAEVVELPVSSEGQLSWEAIEQAVTPETALVSVMWANNETGVLFPVERIGALCRERGVPFHVDAVQVAGKRPIDLSRVPVDLLSLSAHKLSGPKGIGALYIRKGTPHRAVQTGGHQERGRRGGTENVAAIAGLGVAAGLAAEALARGPSPATTLRDELERRLLAEVADVRIVGRGAERVGNTLMACFCDVEGEALLMALDLAGICVSSGSACTAGSLEPSHVIQAMGFAPAWARGAVRFSFGRGNTEDEVAQVAAAVAAAVQTLRSSRR
jgi:cysteine desulfurase